MGTELCFRVEEENLRMKERAKYRARGLGSVEETSEGTGEEKGEVSYPGWRIPGGKKERGKEVDFEDS